MLEVDEPELVNIAPVDEAGEGDLGVAMPDVSMVDKGEMGEKAKKFEQVGTCTRTDD